MKRVFALILLLAAAPVWADATVTVSGNAAITAGDVQAARARALDDAYRAAVTAQLTVMYDDKTRAAGADAIKKRLLRKAKGYVTQFKILNEAEDGAAYKIEIEAVVADTVLAADARAAGVGAPPPTANPGPGMAPPPPAFPKRPQIALLAVTSDGDTITASFGRGATAPGPAAEALGREIAARGFKVVNAPGVDVPIIAEPGETRLPLQVAQAWESRAASAPAAMSSPASWSRTAG